MPEANEKSPRSLDEKGPRTCLTTRASFSAIALLTVVFGDTGGAEKLLGIVVVSLGWLFYVIWTRVGLEVVIALFKIMENTNVLARAAQPAPPPRVTSGESADRLL